MPWSTKIGFQIWVYILDFKFVDPMSRSDGGACQMPNLPERRERETLHLFQPPKADQMPIPHQGQYTPRQSANQGTPCKSACSMKWTFLKCPRVSIPNVLQALTLKHKVYLLTNMVQSFHTQGLTQHNVCLFASRITLSCVK